MIRRFEELNRQSCTLSIALLEDDKFGDLVIVHFIDDSSRETGEVESLQERFAGYRVVTINQELGLHEEDNIHAHLKANTYIWEKDELRSIETTIDQNTSTLFDRHSNLQAISSSRFKSQKNGTLISACGCIVLYCSLKGYRPIGEEKFPRKIGNFSTDVREGYALSCGVREVNDPLGLGCSVGSLDRKVFGSVGPFIKKGLQSCPCGFISCAHVFFEYEDLHTLTQGCKCIINLNQRKYVVQPGQENDNYTFKPEICGDIESGYYGDISTKDPITREPIDITVDMVVVRLLARQPGQYMTRPVVDAPFCNKNGKKYIFFCRCRGFCHGTESDFFFFLFRSSFSFSENTFASAFWGL